MGSTRKHAVIVGDVTYASKSDAGWALYQAGTTEPQVIADLIGSTRLGVQQIIKTKRRELAKGNAATEPGAWTPEKRDKARRLFGQTMIHIADAIQVPAAEFLSYVLRGVIPPSQAVKDPGDIRWVPASGMPQVQAQLPAPVAEVVSFIDHVAATVPDVLDYVDVEGSPVDDQADLAASQWLDDPEATFNILMLTNADVTRDTVDSWSPEQRRLAEDWAGATHLSAGDQDDLVVPPRPDFVPLRPLQIGTNSIIPDTAAIDGPEIVAALQQIAGDPVTREVAPAALPRFQAVAPANARAVSAAKITGEVRLIDETGRFLHESLDGMTTNPRFAWKGDAAKVKAVQQRLPHTRQLDVVAA